MYKSKCCNADVRWVLSPDFLGDNPKKMKVGTCYFECEKCEKACDVEIDKSLFKKGIKHRKVNGLNEAKALANFLVNEKKRHEDDIEKITHDLRCLEEKYGVTPSGYREFVDP